MPHNKNEIFPPFRLVAEFADGTRRTFDGLTRDQAYQSIVSACAQYGDIVWYNGVTDEHYTDGIYHKLSPGPDPIHLPFPLLDLTDYHGDGIPDAPFVDDGDQQN